MSRYCFILLIYNLTIYDLQFIGIIDYNGGVFVGNMRGLDAPLFGVQVVSPCADILHGAQGMSVEADLHDASWRIGVECQRFTAQELHGLLIGKFDTRYCLVLTSRNLVGDEP